MRPSWTARWCAAQNTARLFSSWSPPSGSRLQVMNVHELRVTAAGHHAALAIAPQDPAAYRRRNGLRRALGDAPVGVAGGRLDVLRIALSHLDRGGFDPDELAASLLRAAAATRADAHGHLVRGATLVARSAQQVSGHRQQ